MVTTHMYRKTLLNKYWQALDNVIASALTPKEFLGFWSLTREDLADICGCSIATVNRWCSSRFEKGYHIRLINLIHHFWLPLKDKPIYARLALLNDIANKIKSVDEFLAHWDITYQKIGVICCCSPRTVKGWRAEWKQPYHQLLLLGLTHYLWREVSQKTKERSPIKIAS